MEPDKRKPMSILSDLDPRNTRFIDSPAPARISKAIWLLALLPLLGAIWLFLSFKVDLYPTGHREASLPPPDAVPPTSPPTMVPSVAPDKSQEGSARILAAAPQPRAERSEKEPGADVFQTMQRELDKPMVDKRDRAPEHRTGAAAKPKTKHEKVKPAAMASAKKAGPGNSASSPQRTGNPAQRDIDIISAIVR